MVPYLQLELSPECNPEHHPPDPAHGLGFNPHSSFRPSATDEWLVEAARALKVSILTRAFARVQLNNNGGIISRVAWVSILTRAFARVQLGQRFPTHTLHVVSILTRAFARVQPAPLASPDRLRRFQSSLELSPECNIPGVRKPRYNRTWEFQSSLELSPECNPVVGVLFTTLAAVSILTRAFARVQPTRIEAGYGRRKVSILTRAFARVQRWPCPARWVGSPPFQSSLELSPECNQLASRPVMGAGRFQSSLELSPECNLLWENRRRLQAPVSILTRAFARVQPTVSLVCREISPVSILTRAFARVQPGVRYSTPSATSVSILTRAFARVQLTK